MGLISVTNFEDNEKQDGFTFIFLILDSERFGSLDFANICIFEKLRGNDHSICTQKVWHKKSTELLIYHEAFMLSTG